MVGAKVTYKDGGFFHLGSDRTENMRLAQFLVNQAVLAHTL
jgi:hypothetical protein